MTPALWNCLQRGDMVQTTKKLLVVGAVTEGKHGLNELQLHWIRAYGTLILVDGQATGELVVTASSYNTADPGPYQVAGRLPKDAEFTTGQKFWPVSRQVTAQPARSWWNRLVSSSKAARLAFSEEWTRA